MARDTKRMALYEAIRKGQSKRQGGRRTVFLRPFGSGRGLFGRRRKRDASLSSRLRGVGAGYSPRRSPGLMRTRLHVSLRLVAVVLVAVAMLGFASVRFIEKRSGQKWGIFGARTGTEQPGGGVGGGPDTIFPEPAGSQRIETLPPDGNGGAPKPKAEERPKPPAKPAAPKGTNLIVIQEFSKRRDLEPVQEHFAGNGIDTEIVQRGSYFFLVTKQLYERCSVDSSSFNAKYDGDVARAKIKQVGATYKAPPGYETFRPNLFQDAYAQKVR